MSQSRKAKELQKGVVKRLSEVRIEKWPSVLKVMCDPAKRGFRSRMGIKA